MLRGNPSLVGGGGSDLLRPISLPISIAVRIPFFLGGGGGGGGRVCVLWGGG